MRLDAFEPEAANALLGAMAAEAETLTRSAAGDQELSVTRSVFMRYLGQGHEIAIELTPGPLSVDDAVRLRERFEAQYRRLFQRHIPGAVIEILSWSIAVGTLDEPPAVMAPVARCAGPAEIGRRALIVDSGAEQIEVPVYDRAAFRPGSTVEGPAIIVEAGTSTFVSALFDAWLDGGGALVLDRRTSPRSPA